MELQGIGTVRIQSGEDTQKRKAWNMSAVKARQVTLKLTVCRGPT